MQQDFKVKYELRSSGKIDIRTVPATDPISAANKVREAYKGQSIVVVTVKPVNKTRR